jgi:hypothetical protein
MNTLNLREKDDKFGKIYWGTVAQNTDPTKQGRIKVNLPEVYGDSETSDLPWIYPLGYNSGVRLFNVPDEKTEIGVVFIGDFYTGFYGIGKYPKSESKIFDEDYPNVYGMEDLQGNSFTVNKRTGFITVTHKTGSIIQIDGEGNIKLQTEGGITLDAVAVHATNSFEVGSAYSGTLQDGSGAVFSVVGGIVQSRGD